MQDMTIYQLKQAFRQSLALFYSDSLGSLQVALRKLLDRGLVSATEVREGRRVKKVYHAGPQGKKAFLAGMKAEISPARLEAAALARVHFLGLLPPRDRREVLALIERAILSSLEGLEGMKRELDGLPVPASYRGIFGYQLKTLEYGIMSHRAGLDWFRALRESEARHD
jgi:DNA-binding PadR family transcriptional regulator